MLTSELLVLYIYLLTKTLHCIYYNKMLVLFFANSCSSLVNAESEAWMVLFPMFTCWLQYQEPGCRSVTGAQRIIIGAPGMGPDDHYRGPAIISVRAPKAVGSHVVGPLAYSVFVLWGWPSHTK